MIDHLANLTKAVRLSKQSIDGGSSPFGCIIVNPQGEIVGEGHNRVALDNDPTAHGEVMAIRNACRNLNSFDLSGCILYTSCEPCPMCLNACKWANIAEIYYAADRYDAENIGFRDRVFTKEIRSNCITWKLRKRLKSWRNGKTNSIILNIDNALPSS